MIVQLVCLLLGILCIFYGITVRAAGSGTAFFIVWFLIGAAFILLAVLLRRGIPGRCWAAMPSLARWGIGILLGFFAASFLIAETCILSSFREKGEKDLDFLIVLGAQVWPSGPSITLRHRLDAAAEYLLENEGTRCIVSGGQGYNEPETEAAAMKRYLTDRGIAPERLIPEDKATSTRENIRFSMAYLDPDKDRVGIVTNNFHLFRGKSLAKKAGIRFVSGIAADSNRLFLPNNLLREFFGTVKDVPAVAVLGAAAAIIGAGIYRMARALRRAVRRRRRPSLLPEGERPLYEAVREKLGNSAVCGTSIVSECFADEGFLRAMRVHFTELTIGNEMKPAALLGKDGPRGFTDTPKGRFPVLDFAQADGILSAIRTWNEGYPDLPPIRVRGHVLVWHRQTPSWFFRKDYDPSLPYVGREEMDLRMEWYIREVLTHFAGKGSPFRDLFYAWDVVNEAVSDRTGSWRTDEEMTGRTGSRQSDAAPRDGMTGPETCSDWWRVYGNEDYIRQAFVYANRYAPAEVALYYNDYNECAGRKAAGIRRLIETVRQTPEARLDGLGMEAHYRVGDPAPERFAEMLLSYAEMTGLVMLTELDAGIAESALDEGKTAGRERAFAEQADYYGQLLDALVRVNEKTRGAVAGITFWGIADGAAVTLNRDAERYGLLFDEAYRPKAAYWEFVRSRQRTGVEPAKD